MEGSKEYCVNAARNQVAETMLMIIINILILILLHSVFPSIMYNLKTTAAYLM